MNKSIGATGVALSAPLVWKRAAAVVLGAALVAVGAQISIPVPFNPVPITFEVPAVLLVGAFLGPQLGATSMVVYLLAGAVGLPVFAPTVPLVGMARLLGPTGGYLLAYPLAAAAAGRFARPTAGWLALFSGLALATLIVYAGGVAQLAILTGSLGGALVAGALPFVAGDLIKLILAGLVVRRLGPSISRALH